MLPTTPDYPQLLASLKAAGQEHVLRFYPELTPDAQRALLRQVAALDLASLPRLIEAYVVNKPKFELPPNLRPAPYYPLDAAAPGMSWDKAPFRKLGEDLLRAGKVGAFTVAGGQGSRLGYEGPKGCYPAGAVSRKPLFEIFADGIAAASRKYGKPVPWYIMTSPLNHQQTVDFFTERTYFGLDPSTVMFFPQGVMPSLDLRSGKMLMTTKSEIATNPDGHGGALKALYQSGAVADMKRRHVEHLSYFQVDNPIVKVVDPLFIGLHASTHGADKGEARSSGEMSSKMIPKAYPEEKLGVFCRVDDRTEVIEYSDLPKELASQRLADGTLRFLAGSIAVHIISVGFIERINTDASFELPYHRAEKKIPCIDPVTGAAVTPVDNNGVKLERFVFDALAMCSSAATKRRDVPGSIVMETDRIEEFAPIKNATGVDSMESSRAIQTQRAARWLERHNVKIPRRDDGAPDCILEISPRTALEPEDLAGAKLPKEIQRGQQLVI